MDYEYTDRDSDSILIYGAITGDKEILIESSRHVDSVDCEDGGCGECRQSFIVALPAKEIKKLRKALKVALAVITGEA